MRKRTQVSTVVLGCSLLLPGCQPPAASPTGSSTQVDRHDHDHPHHGPNGGDLIELGSEEYHAEFLHDDTGLLTIILLDATAKTPVTIEAGEIVLNVKAAESAQYTLTANPAEGEQAGQSSRFQRTDAELAKLLDQTGTEATLVVTIAGKQYRGKLNHQHGAHDHDHDHDHDH